MGAPQLSHPKTIVYHVSHFDCVGEQRGGRVRRGKEEKEKPCFPAIFYHLLCAYVMNLRALPKLHVATIRADSISNRKAITDGSVS
eukprot:scaffold53079_cov47-Attheya_sp.AAC.2